MTKQKTTSAAKSQSKDAASTTASVKKVRSGSAKSTSATRLAATVPSAKKSTPRASRTRKGAAALPQAATHEVPRNPAAPLTKEQLRHMAEARHRAIAVAAYLRAERRGFVPGMELHDWLAAEAEYNIRAESS